MIRPFTLIFLFILSATAWSHGALHDQIDDVSQQLKKDKQNAALYLKRGHLYQKVEHYSEAIHDFKKSLKLEPELQSVHYHLAQTLLAIGQSDAAEQHARLFIASLEQKTYGGLSRGYGLLGKIFEERNKYLNAARAYEKSLQNNMQPRPYNYLQPVNVYVKSGQKYHQHALTLLDKGINKLGPIVTLQEAAIVLELSSKHYDAALSRVKTLRSQGISEANIYFKQALIMSKARRPEDALTYYKMALTEIEHLSVRKQSSKAMRKLRRTIENSMSK